MSERIEVADVESFETDSRQMVLINGKPIGVLRVDGEYYAIENRCPHQNGPLCSGEVGGAIEAEVNGVGERVTEYIGERKVIACPWHGWEFDLETGLHEGDPDYQVETFDVSVENGVVYVHPE